MCELFAMSSRWPATVRLSLEAFSRHGGLEGPHKDGWGIAHYAGRDVRLLKETAPASDSACVRFIQEHPVASSIVISHIRRATQGAPRLANCQPFARELGGFMHVFAHNGDLDAARLKRAFALRSYHPVGETDSEYAFCALLERLRDLWLEAEGPPPIEQRLAVVADFAAGLRAFGPANFLYADGDAVFAHGHRRRQNVGVIAPPGLHVLSRRCARERAALSTPGLIITDVGAQAVTLFASVPLTKERDWRPLAEGELLVAREGEIAAGVAAPGMA